jgi:hypothetical protein
MILTKKEKENIKKTVNNNKDKLLKMAIESLNIDLYKGEFSISNYKKLKAMLTEKYLLDYIEIFYKKLDLHFLS